MDYPSNTRKAGENLMGLRLRLPTRDLSFVAVMTGLSVTTNYLLLSVPNVKFMDLFVFVSGFVAGPFVGVLVGAFTWLVYGTLNPYGFSLPILFATMVGESLYGLVGGLAGKFGLSVPNGVSVSSGDFWISNLKFALLGFLITFVYDLFTNVISALVAELPILLTIIVGIPFALAHEVSNLFFFLFGASVTINAVRVFVVKGR